MQFKDEIHNTVLLPTPQNSQLRKCALLELHKVNSMMALIPTKKPSEISYVSQFNLADNTTDIPRKESNAMPVSAWIESPEDAFVQKVKALEVEWDWENSD